MARSGARWKNLPTRLGSFQTVKRRYCRWLKRGLVDQMFERLSGCRSRMADARQHDHPRPSACGRRADKKGAPKTQGLGRSKGGFSTKLSTATDALGNPCHPLAGPGQENDMIKNFDLIDGIEPAAVLADRAYDADRLMDAILDVGAEPVIPPRRHRKHQHAYAKAL
jgi:transposase